MEPPKFPGRFRIEEGLSERNPASVLRKPAALRTRERLTMEGCESIHKCAPTWLKNAMDLGLQTLQRREDIVSLRWEAESAGYLRVQQEKTGKRLAIEITEPLRAVLSRCRDRLVSPYIIHRAPEKRRSREDRAQARENPTQVMPEQLTRAFQDAREKCGFYAESGHPPGFHEIRSLGAALYRQMG
jgi:integrase